MKSFRNLSVREVVSSPEKMRPTTLKKESRRELICLEEDAERDSLIDEESELLLT